MAKEKQQYLLIKYSKEYSIGDVYDYEEILCVGDKVKIINIIEEILSNLIIKSFMDECIKKLFNDEIIELFNEDRYELIKWKNKLGLNKTDFIEHLSGRYIIMKCRRSEEVQYIQCDNLDEAKEIAKKLKYRWSIFDCWEDIMVLRNVVQY